MHAENQPESRLDVIRRGKEFFGAIRWAEIPEDLRDQATRGPNNDLWACAAAAADAADGNVAIAAPAPGPLALLSASPGARVDLLREDGTWRNVKTADGGTASSTLAVKAGQMVGSVLSALREGPPSREGMLLIYDLDESTLDDLWTALSPYGPVLVPTHRRLLACRWNDEFGYARLIEAIAGACARQTRFQSPKEFTATSEDLRDIRDFVRSSFVEAGLRVDFVSEDREDVIEGDLRRLLERVDRQCPSVAALAWLPGDRLARKVANAPVGKAYSKDLYRLGYKIGEFPHSLGKLERRGSLLYSAVVDGALEFGSVVPHATKPEDHYDFFYASKGVGTSDDENASATSSDAAAPSLLGNKIRDNHDLRKSQAVSHVEYLFHETALRFPGEKLRWLDIGSATGAIVNNVDPKKHADVEADIVGVEFSRPLVNLANRTAAPDRCFLVADARDLPSDVRGYGFHIVTAFELVEHLFDPVAFLRELRPLCKGYFLAASPLAESVNFRTAQAHIWSFRRTGYQKAFELAGYTPRYAFETYVGTFAEGHDWLSVVATPE